MDCIVHGVAKSHTQLSDFHYHLYKYISIYIYVYNYVRFVRGNIERVFCCCFEHATQAAVQLVAVVEVGKLGEEETRLVMKLLQQNG